MMAYLARQREQFQRQFEGGGFQRDVLRPRGAARLRRLLVFRHLADLYIGTEASGQQLDGEAAGRILAEDVVAFGGGRMQRTRVVACRIAGTADEEAALARLHEKRLAALGAGFEDGATALDILLGLQFAIEALPKLAQQLRPYALAVGDVVELVFQLGGEVVIDVMGEMPGQEAIDQAADVGRLE